MNKAKPRVLVLHGPNLNLLGRREPEQYGTMSLNAIDTMLQEKAAGLGIELSIIQTNHEGVMIDAIQQAMDSCSGIIINPAAFTHYSIAVRDALAAVAIPVIEVHLTNIYAREEFRRHSVTAPVATGVVAGLGPGGYLLALDAIARLIDGGSEQ